MHISIMNAIMLCWPLKHLKTMQSYRTCWHWAYPLSSVVCCFSVGVSNLGMPAHIKTIFFSAYICLLDSAQEVLQSCDSTTSTEDLNFDCGVISCKLNFSLFGKVVRDVVEMCITRLPWVFFFFNREWTLPWEILSVLRNTLWEWSPQTV